MIPDSAAARMPGRDPVLAFSTSGAFCAAALLRGDGPALVRHEEMARGQVERLMPFLQETLEEGGLGWRDLSALGVGIGPGNFTGIRIAVSAARGLALGLGIPAIGVSSFDALAHGHARPVLTLVEAPRGQVYVQEFRETDATPPRLAGPEDLINLPDIPTLGAAERIGRKAIAPMLPAVEAMAHIARTRAAQADALPRPAPLYIVAAGAVAPSDPPPVILP